MNYSLPLLKGSLLAASLLTVPATMAADGVSVSASCATYTVTNLGVVGGDVVAVSGMNASGQIIVAADMTSAANPQQLTGRGGQSIPTLRVFISTAGKLQDMGNLGGQRIWANAINDSGQVAGSAETEPWAPNMAPSEGPTQHAFLYDKGKLKDLGTLGGKNSRANAINSSGQIAGQADTANSTRHAFLFRNGKMKDLGVLGGINSEALFITDDGQIAGVADTNPNIQSNATQEALEHAFLYQDGKMHDLGTLGGKNSRPNAINSAGDVVGWADVAMRTMNAGTITPRAIHAFLYHNGKLLDLGTLGGDNSSAEAINDSGQIVGGADVNSVTAQTGSLPPPQPTRHAFLFSDGRMQDLGALNAKNSDAVAINTAGQIVGYSGDGTGWKTNCAFLYDKGKMQDLNLLVGNATLAKVGFKILLTANGINDRGQIFGTALDKDGKKAAYVLTPANSSPFVLP